MKELKVKFASYDGFKLEGTIAMPSVKVVGAALFVHGITSSRDELGFHSDMAHYLADKGILTLRFDYRYHGDEETKLENLTLCGIINDINAAYKALLNEVADVTDTFFLVATSFGGGLGAFWADYIADKRIKKIFLNAPVLDYEDDVLRRNGLAVNGRLVEKAVKQLNTKGFVKSSDIQFGRGLINELPYIDIVKALHKLGKKVMIFHGNEDEDVPLLSSQKNKSSKNGLTVIEGVGHGFGIDIDEDLTHPETKKIHKKIYEHVSVLMEKETRKK